MNLQEAVETTVREGASASSDGGLSSLMSISFDDVIKVVQDYGPRVLSAVVPLVVGWFAARWLSKQIRTKLEKRRFDTTLARFFAQLAKYGVLLGAVMVVLGILGIPTTSFAAVIGAAGLAIGLAFQGTLGNFSAGLMLLVFRPFNVGDLITTAGVTGICEEIGLFTSTFKTLDNRRLIIPNGEVTNGVIENVGVEPLRRVDVDVGTDYSVDVDHTRQILEAAITTIKGGLTEPAPQVFLGALGGSSVDWQMRVWCKSEDYWDVWQETVRVTKHTLDENGVGIPFPQMDVHIDGRVGRAEAREEERDRRSEIVRKNVGG